MLLFFKLCVVEWEVNKWENKKQKNIDQKRDGKLGLDYKRKTDDAKIIKVIKYKQSWTQIYESYFC